MNLRPIIIALLLVGLFCGQARAETTVLFSPNGGIRDKIIAKINLSRRSIKLAIYSFTSGEIAGALARAKERGVTVEVVMDRIQAHGNSSEINYLVQAGIPVKILSGKGRRGIMHNKFAVFDERSVVTGSYNWTENAEKYNYENAVFTDDPPVVSAFSQAFTRLLAR